MKNLGIKFIKHNKYIDVACLVLKEFNTGNKYKFEIEWWNLGAVNSYSMGIEQNIEIDYDEIKEWQWCIPNNNEQLRLVSWNYFT